MKDLSLFDYFVNCYKNNYFNFSGRARRKEFWGFVLFYVLIALALSILLAILGNIIDSLGFVLMVPILLFGLCSIIPMYAVTVRRLHDVDKSGWWIFLSILQAIPYLGLIIALYFLYLFCKEGDSVENDYGINPKDEI